MSVPEETENRDDVVILRDLEVVAKGPKAILVEGEAVEDLDDKERWFPFSQIDDDSEIFEASNKGDTGDLVITDWLAKKKGLI